ncbi:MAG: hypothetical protein IPJ88_06125 [Myxococcales bacterium]|nr:MAG: hypothetical protein IPJ88_06125 [Myxococcales bacterium]
MSSDETKREKHREPQAGATRAEKSPKSASGHAVNEEAATVIGDGGGEVSAWRSSLRPRLGSRPPSQAPGGISVPPALPLAQRHPTETVVHQRSQVPEGSRKGQILPWRTWILLSLSICVAVYVFFIDESSSSTNETNTSSVKAQRIEDSFETSEALTEEPQSVNAEAIVPKSRANKQQVQESEKTLGRSTADLESLAVEAWLRGDLFDALVFYKGLIKREPENKSFALMVDILRTQLAKSCEAGQEPC